MNSFIYDLFLGEEDPLNAPHPQEEEIRDAQAMFERLRERLHAGLNKEQQQLLLRIEEEHTLSLELVKEAGFLRGFQIGGRLVAELLR